MGREPGAREGRPYGGGEAGAVGHCRREALFLNGLIWSHLVSFLLRTGPEEAPSLDSRLRGNDGREEPGPDAGGRGAGGVGLSGTV